MKNQYNIASWNVNSVRARLDAVCAWLQEHQPDVLALQETKVENGSFPKEAFEVLGYHVLFHGQKSYNGMATISKLPLTDVVIDEECRRLSATLDMNGTPLRIVNVYVPNGQDLSSEKYVYKLAWFENLRDLLAEELTRYPETLILGDFNVAPTDDDVFDPKLWHERILVSSKERFALEKLFHLGFKDSFRLFDQPKEKYSWWDYRAASFRRNMGLRIDLILLSRALAGRCTHSDIDKTPRGGERPSDHAPVWVMLK